MRRSGRKSHRSGTRHPRSCDQLRPRWSHDKRHDHEPFRCTVTAPSSGRSTAISDQRTLLDRCARPGGLLESHQQRTPRPHRIHHPRAPTGASDQRRRRRPDGRLPHEFLIRMTLGSVAGGTRDRPVRQRVRHRLECHCPRSAHPDRGRRRNRRVRASRPHGLGSGGTKCLVQAHSDEGLWPADRSAQAGQRRLVGPSASTLSPCSGLSR